MPSVPRRVTPPREEIHKVFCATQYECKHEGAKDPSVWCRVLDELLDVNDEMLLHAKAREFESELEELHRRRVHLAGRIGAGLLRAAEMTDPFNKIDAFDPEMHEVNDAAEENPHCPACVAGREHYHRKSDGSRVRFGD